MATVVKIVSGGQTGADRAGLDAALAVGLPHGGWCPRGRLAEDGAIPDRYQLRESNSSKYIVRTERNVCDSDATLVFYEKTPSGGTAATMAFARRHRKPFLALDIAKFANEDAIATYIRGWLSELSVQGDFVLDRVDVRAKTDWTGSDSAGGMVLNIAGPRESTLPGIERTVYRVLVAALTC